MESEKEYPGLAFETRILGQASPLLTARYSLLTGSLAPHSLVPLSACSLSLRYLPKRQVIPIRPRNRMMSRLHRQHSVKPHPRRTSPHNHISMFQQDPPRRIGPL